MDFRSSSAANCQPSSSSAMETRTVTSQPPPVASCSSALHPCHHYGGNLDAGVYVLKAPRWGWKLNGAEDEVSNSNIFADSYAKSIGLYAYPKPGEGEARSITQSDEHSSGLENDDVEGPLEFRQRPIKASRYMAEECPEPRYIADQGAEPWYNEEEGRLFPGSSTDDSFNSHLHGVGVGRLVNQPLTDMTSGNLSFQQQPSRLENFFRHAEVVELEQNIPVEQLEPQPTIPEDLSRYEEENVNSIRSWNDSESYESDAMLPTCSGIGCPGNITPYFLEFTQPQNKMVSRDKNRLQKNYLPSESVMGAMPDEQRKLMLRRMKNRVAAKRCRRKKKEEFSLLLNEQDTLLDDVHVLYHEIQILKNQLSFHSTPTGNPYASF